MNQILWGVFPYVALTLFFVVPFIRMAFRPFGMSTRASGIFGRRLLGLASLLLHWGIMLVFFGHIAGLIGGILGWGSWIGFFFVAGAVGGLAALAGSIIALLRRLYVPQVRAMSQPDDYLVHLFIIAILGVALYQGLVDRIWGVAYAGAPWFGSLWRFQPQPELMASAGLLTQIHVFLGLLFAAYFPFTKLVHAWTLPINYFVRPYQAMRTVANKFTRRWEFGLRSDKSFLTYAVILFIGLLMGIGFFLKAPTFGGAQVASVGTVSAVFGLRGQEGALEGYALYVSQCARCHGLNGDGEGDGKNSRTFTTFPRDFTAGRYRFVSTETGVATDADLKRTIVSGLSGTGMPAFPQLTERQVGTLVGVLDSMWKGRPDQGPAVAAGPRPVVTPASVKSGRQLFADACTGCHGDTGAGNGAAAAGIEDFPGHHLPPANLAAGKVKAGRTPTDLYQRIAAGIPNGDAPLMPPFGTFLSPADIWAVIDYLEAEVLPKVTPQAAGGAQATAGSVATKVTN